MTTANRLREVIKHLARALRADGHTDEMVVTDMIKAMLSEHFPDAHKLMLDGLEAETGTDITAHADQGASMLYQEIKACLPDRLFD